MVSMAESSKAFQMYHYKQMTKESADSEDSFYEGHMSGKRYSRSYAEKARRHGHIEVQKRSYPC